MGPATLKSQPLDIVPDILQAQLNALLGDDYCKDMAVVMPSSVPDTILTNTWRCTFNPYQLTPPCATQMSSDYGCNCRLECNDYSDSNSPDDSKNMLRLSVASAQIHSPVTLKNYPAVFWLLICDHSCYKPRPHSENLCLVRCTRFNSPSYAVQSLILLFVDTRPASTPVDSRIKAPIRKLTCSTITPCCISTFRLVLVMNYQESRQLIRHYFTSCRCPPECVSCDHAKQEGRAEGGPGAS